MKVMRRIMVLCLVLSLVITGYTPRSASAAAKKVKLNKKTVSLKVGKTVKLQVKNAKKKAKWSIKSGKQYIALKNKKKKSVVVRAKKAGTATVVAKIGKKKLTCKVKVTKASGKTPGKTDSKDDPNKKVTGVPGKNVPLPAGATTFTFGTKKLAIGMAKADVYTVLGSLSTQEIRDDGKSPQGFDVIAYNTNDYKEYLLIYLQDNKVTGICGIAKTMSFGDAEAGGYGTGLSNDWKNSPDYKTTVSRSVAARTRKISANESVYAFFDALSDNKIYCIQVFDSTKIKKEEDMIFGTTGHLSYDAKVNASIATETGKMLNAFRAYYGKSVFSLNANMAKCAQEHCNQAVANGVKQVVSRQSDVLFGVLDGYGVFAGNCAEECYSDASDTISFVNSMIEDETFYADLVGNEAKTWRHLGVGMAASSAHTYLTVDYVDVTNF